MLHTKYGSPGPCGFGEEDFLFCFTHCKYMGAICCYGKDRFDTKCLKPNALNLPTQSHKI